MTYFPLWADTGQASGGRAKRQMSFAKKKTNTERLFLWKTEEELPPTGKGAKRKGQKPKLLWALFQG